MKKSLSLACIGLLSLLFSLTSFKTDEKNLIVHKAAPYQIVINNNSSKTISSCKVGSYAAYTGLSIGPGGSATFGETTPLSGPITVSVTCTTSWTGTIEYDEWETEVACWAFTQSALTHSLSANASDVYLRVITISNETRPCIDCEANAQ